MDKYYPGKKFFSWKLILLNLRNAKAPIRVCIKEKSQGLYEYEIMKREHKC